MENNELAHYGVLGMKWGVRKQKYYEKKARSSSGSKSKKYAEKAAKQARANKKYKKAYRAQILSDPTKLYKHRKDFSKEEIDKAMSNFNREQKLRGYSRDKKSYNSQNNKISKGLAIAGTIVGTAELAKRGKEVTDYFLRIYKKGSKK